MCTPFSTAHGIEQVLRLPSRPKKGTRISVSGASMRQVPHCISNKTIMAHASPAAVRGVSANKSSLPVVGSDLLENDVVERGVFQLSVTTPHTQSEGPICPVCSVLPFNEVHSRSASSVIEHWVDITTLDQNLLMRRYDACGACELIVDLIRAWASDPNCSSLRFPYKGRNYFWACCNRRSKICVESSTSVD